MANIIRANFIVDNTICDAYAQFQRRSRKIHSKNRKNWQSDPRVRHMNMKAIFFTDFSSPTTDKGYEKKMCASLHCHSQHVCKVSLSGRSGIECKRILQQVTVHVCYLTWPGTRTPPFIGVYPYTCENLRVAVNMTTHDHQQLHIRTRLSTNEYHGILMLRCLLDTPRDTRTVEVSI